MDPNHNISLKTRPLLGFITYKNNLSNLRTVEFLLLLIFFLLNKKPSLNYYFKYRLAIKFNKNR